MKEEEIITSQQRRLAQEVGRRDHPITTMKTGQSKQKIITRVFAKTPTIIISREKIMETLYLQNPNTKQPPQSFPWEVSKRSLAQNWASQLR